MLNFSWHVTFVSRSLSMEVYATQVFLSIIYTCVLHYVNYLSIEMNKYCHDLGKISNILVFFSYT